MILESPERASTVQSVQLPGGSESETARTNRPLRVMHLVLKFGFGGAEGGVLKLANGFDRSRVEPSVCSCWPADTLKSHLRADVPLFEMNRRRGGNDLVFVFRLFQLLRRWRPDVLHTHGWATLCEGLVAGRLAGVPVIVHGEHGTVQAQRRHRIAQRIVWRRTDGVLSVSARLTEKLAATVGFPVERIVTIRNGVDAKRFTPLRRASARAAFGFGPADLVVGTVGRLEPVKDQRTFISALAVLAREGVRLRALVAGDGALHSDLRETAERFGLGNESLRFLGKRLDVEDVLAALDIFVLSSRSEGLSNTILEAMATGLPVVATDVGGTGELVTPGVTGLLVPPMDADALAGAVRQLVADPSRRLEMGAAGRLRAESEFDLDGTIRHYEDFYMELARRKSILAPAR